MTRNCFLAIVMLLALSSALAGQTGKQVIGYYPSWQWYDRAGLVNPKTIDYTKYTIINYAFFQPLPDGSIAGFDAWADENLLLGEINWGTSPPSYYPNTSLVDIAHNNGVKVLISIGGWTLSSNFPSIAADPAKRAVFAQSCVDLIVQYDLDGVDIDWEYPGYQPHGGSPADRENFTLLLQDIRSAIDAHGAGAGRHFLLTACVGASRSHMSSVEWDEIPTILDYINLMSYDFFGSWDPITNHNSPLYAPAQGDPEFNVHSAVTRLIQEHNVPPEKLTAGIPFYGRSVKTVGPAGLHVSSTGQPDTATFSDDEGIPLYFNVLLKAHLFDAHRDDLAKVPYMTGKGGLETFLSYDDEVSVELKARYVKDHDLAGVIVWEITGDCVETYPGSGQIAGTPLAESINSVFCNPVLSSDAYELSGSGGTVVFQLDAGTDHAGRPYLLLGSWHGTEPGTPLPSGSGTIPLNRDALTNVIIKHANGPVFQNFKGVLDGEGRGSATLNCGPIPGAIGRTAHFAFALKAPWDGASNPVKLDIMP